jgi:hypothetical protein
VARHANICSHTDTTECLPAPSGDLLANFFTTGVAAESNVPDELTKLADLRDRGALTEAEFEAQKAKLLAGS